MDKRVLLWNVHDTSTDEDTPKVSIKALDIAHAASVRALAYSPSRSWLVSAAGAKLAVTDVSTGQAIVKAGKQKWASNDVFNVHFHAKDPNMLLVEVRNCVFSNDAQLIHRHV
jgi:WD40 repeat protein